MFAENISLEDCLYAFFSADHLHGDDMYSCEKCSKFVFPLKSSNLINNITDFEMVLNNVVLHVYQKYYAFI